MRVAGPGPVGARIAAAGPAALCQEKGFGRPFKLALCINSWGLLLAICLGWWTSEDRGVFLVVDDSGVLDPGDYWPIVANNLFVLLTVVAGAFTLGFYTFMVVAWNGYLLGVGLASLAQAPTGMLPIAAPHVPLEFAAILLAASAAHVFMANLFKCLSHGHSLDAGSVATVLVSAITLVLVAAIFEAGIIAWGWSG